MSHPDNELHHLLTQQDWGSIGKELLRFAIWRASFYPWHSGSTAILGAGNTPYDIVQRVILKTISGERRWDPERGELKPWLIEQVKSEVDNAFNAFSHSQEQYFPDGVDDNDLSGEEYVELRATGDSILGSQRVIGAEEEFIIVENESEKAELVKSRVSEIVNVSSDEPKLLDVVEAILDGCEPKACYLAEWLGTTREDIYNRLKRLRNLVTSLK